MVVLYFRLNDFCSSSTQNGGDAMAGNENQKLKLLYLMQILSEKTDKDHPLTIDKIITELSLTRHEISAERKSIHRDIKRLNEFKEDSIKRTNNAGYYLDKRDFELVELKLFIDAVQSSKFIDKDTSAELIKKIKKLTSESLASELKSYIDDRIKVKNKDIYKNISTLHNAIIQNKMVSFKYYEYTVEKKRQYRKNGEPYIVSPYELSWVNDNYYLISHYPKYEYELTHFRVDRMSEVTILEDNRKNIKDITGDKEFNTAKYSRKIFSMFSGENEEVELLFHNSLINVVIDRFGEDIVIHKKDKEHFWIRVDVAISNTFMTWLFMFGDKVKILSPEHLVNKMREMAKKVVDLYAQSQ